jgi:hypothetical protein
MDTKPVRIYSAQDVPRLRYIAEILLGDILGLTWEIITDKRKLGKHPIINYSGEMMSGCLNIAPCTLLFETTIYPRDITVTEWKGVPVFFQTTSPSDLPFDIFAASFFLVSRYEEYLEHQSDECERFPATASLAFKNGFLGIPVVDLWAKELAKALVRKFQTLTFKRNEFRSLLTIDSDEPFAYLGKNLISSLGGLFRDLTHNDGHAGDRYRIVVRGEKDPYEVFDYITERIAQNTTDCRFFFPVGDHSKFDKNPSWKNEEYRNLILRISDKYKTGLRPSYFASGNYSLINSENVRLRSVLKNEITMSRFHSIRLFMPQSYVSLLKAGIKEDYSMGYPEEPGFRAGIARPFCFYNISEEQKTDLKIIPFIITDSTLFEYKKFNSEASRELIVNLLSITRKVGGTFVSIWHNTSLLENSDCYSRKEIFEFMLQSQV